MYQYTGKNSVYKPIRPTTYRLVQDNFSLVQLLLNLHNAVCLTGVLVLDNVLLQLRQRACVFTEGGVGEGCARVLGEELVHDLGQKLMRHKRGILAISDDDTSDTLSSTVCVECVRLLLDVLTLPGLRALCDGLGEKHHELLIAVVSRWLTTWKDGLRIRIGILLAGESGEAKSN
jgi:hypothetical protein